MVPLMATVPVTNKVPEPVSNVKFADPVDPRVPVRNCTDLSGPATVDAPLAPAPPPEPVSQFIYAQPKSAIISRPLTILTS